MSLIYLDSRLSRSYTQEWRGQRDSDPRTCVNTSDDYKSPAFGHSAMPPLVVDRNRRIEADNSRQSLASAPITGIAGRTSRSYRLQSSIMLHPCQLQMLVNFLKMLKTMRGLVCE